MKLVRYDRNGAVRLGALDGDFVVDLLDACPGGMPTGIIAALSDMTRLIAAGEDGLKAARAALANAQTTGAGRVPLAKAKLKAPLDPVLILCSGENYWDHRDEKPEVTLRPGVVISTGTPGGTAWGTDPELGGKKPMRRDVVAPQGYLQAGDEVVCEIERIGRLRNRVVAAQP